MVPKKKTIKKETLKDIIDAVAAKEGALLPIDNIKNSASEEYEMPDTDQSKQGQALIQKLSDLLERAKIAEYVKMSERPFRLILLNFLIGLARGFGFFVGASVIVAFVFYLLGQLVSIPYIGEHFGTIIAFFRTAMKAKL